MGSALQPISLDSDSEECESPPRKKPNTNGPSPVPPVEMAKSPESTIDLDEVETQSVVQIKECDVLIGLFQCNATLFFQNDRVCISNIRYEPSFHCAESLYALASLRISLTRRMLGFLLFELQRQPRSLAIQIHVLSEFPEAARGQVQNSIHASRTVWLGTCAKAPSWQFTRVFLLSKRESDDNGEDSPATPQPDETPFVALCGPFADDGDATEMNSFCDPTSSGRCCGGGYFV